ncbi:MAG TPA: DUF1330 domain-containing protein [Bacteroidales bacterium]|nr:DUF1330 domain-containing protein [Bacteroidales bacterium]
MKYYFIAQIKIEDPDEYEKYLEGFDEVFSKYDGAFLVIDEHPEVLEGSWNYSKFVIVSFNSREDFNAWYFSEGYQEILKHRLKAAKCDTVLAEGLE